MTIKEVSRLGKLAQQQIYQAVQKNAVESKYRNCKVCLDGHKFDSKKESQRYAELRLKEQAGLISHLECQRKFDLLPHQKREDGTTERAVSYIADFVYMEDGHIVVEDVKSSITKKRPEYIIKRKLMLFFYGITIREY